MLLSKKGVVAKKQFHGINCFFLLTRRGYNNIVERKRLRNDLIQFEITVISDIKYQP